MNKFKVEAKIINKLVGDKTPLPTYATQGAAGMVWYELGNTSLMLNEPDEAIATYQKQIDIMLNHGMAWNNIKFIKFILKQRK